MLNENGRAVEGDACAKFGAVIAWSLVHAAVVKHRLAGVKMRGWNVSLAAPDDFGQLQMGAAAVAMTRML